MTNKQALEVVSVVLNENLAGLRTRHDTIAKALEVLSNAIPAEATAPVPDNVVDIKS